MRSFIPPELVAAAIALLVVTVFVGPSALGLSGEDPGPTPSATPSDRSPEPTVPRYVTLAQFALIVNERLALTRETLTAELAGPISTASVAGLLREGATTARGGLGIAERLSDIPISAGSGAALVTLYRRAIDIATLGLGAPLSSEVSYRTSGSDLVELLDQLPPIDAALEALIAQPQATPTGGPTPSPAPTPSGPVPTDGSSPAPTPATNLLGNPGFEDGAADWLLALGGGAEATAAVDDVAPHAGARSLRVDITVGSGSRAAVAVRQDGVSLDAGTRYRVAVWARSAEPREIRIRVASAAGLTYDTRVATIATDWSEVALEFASLTTDDSAIVEIHLGRSETTTWLDDAEVIALPS